MDEGRSSYRGSGGVEGWMRGGSRTEGDERGTMGCNPTEDGQAMRGLALREPLNRHEVCAQ